LLTEKTWTAITAAWNKSSRKKKGPPRGWGILGEVEFGAEEGFGVGVAGDLEGEDGGAVVGAVVGAEFEGEVEEGAAGAFEG